MSEMKSLVDKIRTLSPQLNDIADRANDAFRAVESLLHECAPGVTASVLIETGTKPVGEADEGNDYQLGMYLAYCRDGDSGTFRLGFEEAKLDAEGDWESTLSFRPWDQAARDRRIGGYVKLPDLLADIVRQAEDTIQAASGTDGKLAEILEAVSEPKPSKATPGKRGAGSKATIAQVVAKSRRDAPKFTVIDAGRAQKDVIAAAATRTVFVKLIK